MKLAATLRGTTYRFADLKEVMAKANEEKSGDKLAGVAATSATERVAAKLVLSEVTLRELRENPVVPYEHQSSLATLNAPAAREMMELARQAERALGRIYNPDGFNFGLNLGKAAGAGVAGHLHLHALPRWLGDTNFMTATGETRVLPEDLAITWERVRAAFASVAKI